MLSGCVYASECDVKAIVDMIVQLTGGHRAQGVHCVHLHIYIRPQLALRVLLLRKVINTHPVERIICILELAIACTTSGFVV